MKTRITSLASFVVLCASAFSLKAGVVKDLSGTWKVTGENLSGEVRLPGTLADAKLGRHMTAADWEKDTDRRSKGALTREYQFTGKAVYEREFDLTEEEARYPLELVLERVMLYSELSIDGETIGNCDSLAVEHVYQIPQKLTKSGRHKITLTLDNSNRYNFSGWAHSYGPVMQSVWHGVVGEVKLRRQSPLRQTRVFAAWPANGKLKVEVPDGFKADERNLSLEKWNGGELLKISVSSVSPSPYRKGFQLAELKLDRDPEPWSEYHPNLYVLTLRDGAADFSHRVRFGFRSVSAHDHAIWINGHKWFMRGNLDCCHFPLTGAPDTTKQWWRETFRRLRDEDGINTVRFHSWTPPEAAFEVADELGMFVAVEAGIWNDNWHREADMIGSGKPVDGFVRRELRAIVEKRGNSPSFISLGIGNELGGKYFNVMGQWLDDCKAFDPSRLYFASANHYMTQGVLRRTSGSDDYFTMGGSLRYRRRLHPYTDWDYEAGYSQLEKPAVAHEVGQWPIYIDWKHELAKYTGVMRPYNLEHYRDVAKKSGTERFWSRFSNASAKLNRLLYKDDVEGHIRTPSCFGLQLLSVQDFTGQFEAMIGWRDSFYDLKPSVKDLPPFKDVLNSLPHLARFEKYTWSVAETYRASLLVRNLTEEPVLEGTEFVCSIESDGKKIASSVLRNPRTIAPGELGKVGVMALPLTADMAGKKYVLRFGTNSWPFWVFDGTAAESSSGDDNEIFETTSFNDAISALAAGRKVLYTGRTADSARSHFKAVYWSAGHFKQANAALSSLGYMVQNNHPALRGFPTEDWTDWQWYSLVQDGFKHRLSGMPDDYEPIVQPVPDLHYSTFMGMLFELKVGDGKLMVCGLNLSQKNRPEVKAARASIISYMKSDKFDPKAKFSVDGFKDIYAPISYEENKRLPGFANAIAYIAAAVDLGTYRRNVPWKSSYDMVEMTQGKHSVSGAGNWGVWRDDTGAFWHGKKLAVSLTGIRPVNGTLHVRFRDPNGQARRGKGTFEGRPFVIPRHQEAKDGIYWAKLSVMAEDALDGKIEFSCEADSGPNLMIDRVVLVEDM